MQIYFAPYLYFLFLTCISRLTGRSEMRIFISAGALGCILLAGFRLESDNDYSSYLDIFQSIPSLSDGFSAFADAVEDLYLEPAFALLVSAIKIFSLDRQVFLCISFASVLIYLTTLRSLVRYPAIAFLLYISDGYYLREFTQLRFGLAVALGFAGISALYRAKVWHYRCMVLAACMMHATAAFLFVCRIWTVWIRTRRSVFLISTALLIFALAGIFDGLVEYLAGIGLAPLRLVSYLDSDDASRVSITIIVAQYGILLSFMAAIRDDEPEFFFVSVYALSFALLCLFSGFDLMRRTSFYFSTALYVLASVALERRAWALVLMLVAYSGALFMARLAILQPYRSWIS